MAYFPEQKSKYQKHAQTSLGDLIEQAQLDALTRQQRDMAISQYYQDRQGQTVVNSQGMSGGLSGYPTQAGFNFHTNTGRMSGVHCPEAHQIPRQGWTAPDEAYNKAQPKPTESWTTKPKPSRHAAEEKLEGERLLKEYYEERAKTKVVQECKVKQALPALSVDYFDNDGANFLGRVKP